MSNKHDIISAITLGQEWCKPSLSAGYFDALEAMIPKMLEGETLDSILEEMLDDAERDEQQIQAEDG